MGVMPNTKELIESLHLKTLKTLNAHFSKYPYLFGGKPSIGDFGMIALSMDILAGILFPSR